MEGEEPDGKADSLFHNFIWHPFSSTCVVKALRGVSEEMKT